MLVKVCMCAIIICRTGQEKVAKSPCIEKCDTIPHSPCHQRHGEQSAMHNVVTFNIMKKMCTLHYTHWLPNVCIAEYKYPLLLSPYFILFSVLILLFPTCLSLSLFLSFVFFRCMVSVLFSPFIPFDFSIFFVLLILYFTLLINYSFLVFTSFNAILKEPKAILASSNVYLHS